MLDEKTSSYDEFLFAVSGDVNERRSQVILEAFEVMDKDKSGAVNAADLKVRKVLPLQGVHALLLLLLVLLVLSRFGVGLIPTRRLKFKYCL